MRQSTAIEDLELLEQTRTHGPLTHLPDWSSFTPERTESAAQQLLVETRAAFQALESDHEPSWEGLMVPLERLEERLGQLLGWTTHLISVKYSDALQAAYDRIRPEYVRLSSEMSQSRAIYQGMVALRDGSAFAALDPVQQRILSESIRGMVRSGVHLDGDARERYQAIADRLSDLSNRFQTNLVKEEQQSRLIVQDADQVPGVPAAILQLAAQTAREDGQAAADAQQGPWHFIVNGVNYQAVILHASSSSLRESFYRAFRRRGTTAGFDNRPLVTEILELRQEKARLLGFANYAEFSIDAKMAGDTDAVWALINQLEAAARPIAQVERQALTAFMRDALNDANAVLEPWDVGFWSERQREAMYDYDSEALRDYFQLPKVLDGLFSLIQSLYDVDIRKAPAGSVPVWDQAVEFFDVQRDGEVIAGFYVDPFSRPGEKRSGAWMNDVVGRSRTLARHGSAASLPVALFVLNTRPPADGKPALMSLDEVRTLFHEFGHATQHMFTQIDEGGAAGMNLVEWDAVELASQFNEYWMEHKPFLRKLSAQVETGEPLPEVLAQRILDSANFMSATATLRQLLFSKVDLVLHEQYGLADAAGAQSPQDLERTVAAATIVMPILPDESQLPAFGHLFAGGYAAGYYSYKWAEVLAADAFAAFKEVGLDDEQAVRQVAAKFRDTVLSLGGSRPAAEVYRLFRGRDASAQALLAHQGLLRAS